MKVWIVAQWWEGADVPGSGPFHQAARMVQSRAHFDIPERSILRAVHVETEDGTTVGMIDFRPAWEDTDPEGEGPEADDETARIRARYMGRLS